MALKEKNIEDYTVEDRELLDGNKEWPVNLLIWELICMHELFRRLGFPAKDIFLTVFDDRKGLVGMTLKAGGREYTLSFGKCPIPVEDFRNIWIETTTKMNKGEPDDKTFTRIWEKSLSNRKSLSITQDMLQKGFEPPIFNHSGVVTQEATQGWGLA